MNVFFLSRQQWGQWLLLRLQSCSLNDELFEEKLVSNFTIVVFLSDMNPFYSFLKSYTFQYTKKMKLRKDCWVCQAFIIFVLQRDLYYTSLWHFDWHRRGCTNNTGLSFS